MQLTKEQIERNEAEAAEAEKEKDFARIKPDEAKELERGYRAWLAEVEHHETELKQAEVIFGEDMGTLAQDSRAWIEHHRARLAALKGDK